MTAKHTPGPWRYIGDDDGDFIIFTEERNEADFIANIGGSWIAIPGDVVAFDINQSNARLISAAPDLLGAIHTLLDVGHDPADVPYYAKGVGTNTPKGRAYASALVAIAKAQGGLT